MRNTKLTTVTKRLGEIAQETDKKTLDLVMNYYDTFTKIADLAKNDDVPALVKLQALKTIAGEHATLRDISLKQPPQEVDFEGFSDDDLENLLAIAQGENPDMIDVEIL